MLDEGFDEACAGLGLLKHSHYADDDDDEDFFKEFNVEDLNVEAPGETAAPLKGANSGK